MHLTALTCTDVKSLKTLQSLGYVGIKRPEAFCLGCDFLVAGTGFEPAASGL